MPTTFGITVAAANTTSTLTPLSSLTPTIPPSSTFPSTSSTDLPSTSSSVASTLSTTSSSIASSPSSLPTTTTTTTITTLPQSSPSSSSSSSHASSGSSSPQSSASQTTKSASTSLPLETPGTSSSIVITQTSTVQSPPSTVTLSNPNQSSSSSIPQPLPPTTTFQSTFVVTIIDSTGHVITSTPSVFTTVVTSTASNGIVVTVTQVGINQTLSPNRDNTGQSSFFRSTAAVAGVFVLVGLATASILLWIVFAVRRRRRNAKLEHDTIVSATLAAAGFHRAPLDDGDDSDMDNSRKVGSQMNQRSTSGLALRTPSSVPSAVRTSAYVDPHHLDDAEASDPYYDFIPGGVREGYIPSASIPPYGGVYGSGADHVNHLTSHSAGSYEPLLASYHRSTQPPSPPPRIALRLSDAGRTPPIIPHPSGLLDPDCSENNPAGGASSFLLQCDERLDPEIQQRLSGHADDASETGFRDEEDYSRPILGIRNLPDAFGRDSQES